MKNEEANEAEKKDSKHCELAHASKQPLRLCIDRVRNPAANISQCYQKWEHQPK
jgi:hypothetical protein